MFRRLSTIAFGFSLLVSCTVSSNNEQLLLDEIGVLQDRVHELEKELENDSAIPPVGSPTTTEGEGGAAAPASSTTTVAEAGDSNPKTSPLLSLNGEIFIPDGAAGELSVVLLGDPDSSSTVPVVVRNRTDQTYVGIEANGIARNGEGDLVASGSSQGFTPARLHPGEWAFGYIYFGSGELDAVSVFEITLSGNDDGGWFDSFYMDLQVVEFNIVEGSYSREVVGIVKNQTDEKSSSISSASAICFDTQGLSINSIASFGYIDTSEGIPPGGTASFDLRIGSKDEPDECQVFALGVN